MKSNFDGAERLNPWSRPPEGVLDVYAIYQSKDERSGRVIAVQFFCTADGAEAQPNVIGADTVSEIRDLLPGLAGRKLTRVTRFPGDPADLVENWI